MGLSALAGVDMKRLMLPIALLTAPAVTLAASHLLVISGIGGEPEYSDIFYTWSTDLLTAAEQRLNIPRDRIIYLAEQPERDPERIDGRSDKREIENAIAALAQRSQPGDTVFIVMFGHGVSRRDAAQFNIPGPDISATEFATLLQSLAERRVVVVNTSAASGAFVRALSAPGRVVITATASGSEDNYALFGSYFVAAFAEDGADTDKNRRISALEAFDYAQREVQRAYADENRLPTEHALLDDDGDGEGSLEPDPENTDGALARTLFLGEEAVAVVASDDPELAALLTDKQSIESRIEVLRGRKDELAVDDYETQLENLLVELALTTQAIRARQDEL